MYGCGAHCDYGVLTLLVTDGTPGLQILKDDGWHAVPSLPGTVRVNLGDMLQAWTSGKYKSTMHRVRRRARLRRLSRSQSSRRRPTLRAGRKLDEGGPFDGSATLQSRN